MNRKRCHGQTQGSLAKRNTGLSRLSDAQNGSLHIQKAEDVLVSSVGLAMGSFPGSEGQGVSEGRRGKQSQNSSRAHGGVVGGLFLNCGGGALKDVFKDFRPPKPPTNQCTGTAQFVHDTCAQGAWPTALSRPELARIGVLDRDCAPSAGRELELAAAGCRVSDGGVNTDAAAWGACDCGERADAAGLTAVAAGVAARPATARGLNSGLPPPAAWSSAFARSGFPVTTTAS